jgi:hypothetical protein
MYGGLFIIDVWIKGVFLKRMGGFDTMERWVIVRRGVYE